MKLIPVFLLLYACANVLTVTSSHLVMFGQIEIRLRDNGTINFRFLKNDVYTNGTPSNFIAAIEKAKKWDKELENQKVTLTKRISEWEFSGSYIDYIRNDKDSAINLCVPFFSNFRYLKCQMLGSKNYHQLITILKGSEQKMRHMQEGEETSKKLK